MIAARILLAALATLAPAAAPPAPPGADDPVGRAEELAAGRNWDEVVEVLVAFHKTDPGDPRSHTLHGDALAALDRDDEAAHHLALALDLYRRQGLGESRGAKDVNARLLRADPLARARNSFFKKAVKTYVDVAERLVEGAHTERALDLLERVAPFAEFAADKDRRELEELLETVRAAFAEVSLDEAGGEIPEDGGLPLVEHESTYYVVRANLEPDVVQLVAETMDDIFHSYVEVYFDGDWDRATKRKAEIRIHPDHPTMMEEWPDPGRSVGGWWSPGQWRVVCYDTRSDSGSLDGMLRTLFHEASHQFMTMLSSRGGRAPSWLNEGTSSFFEGVRAMADHRVLWPDAAIGRLHSLAAMLGSGSGPSVRDVVSYDEPSSYPGEYYAFGWGLVYYLQQYEDPETLEYVWRPTYRRYREHVTTRGGSSMPLFEEIVLAPDNPGGFRTFDEFAEAWRAWILGTVHPLHVGRDVRGLRRAEVSRYLDAADSGATRVDEEELLLRALGHLEYLRATADPEEAEVDLLLLQADVLERLGRRESAAALLETILGLAAAEAIDLGPERLAEIDERMAKLDRGNYPLRLLRQKTRGLAKSARRLLARYEDRDDPLLLRSWSFAREAGRLLEDEEELLPASERLRLAARDAGLFPSRILRVQGGRWGSVLSSEPRAFSAQPGRVTLEMPGRNAGRVNLDVEVTGEYEVRCRLIREGPSFRSSYHGVVVHGRPDGDWIVVGLGSKGRLAVKRVRVEDDGSTVTRLVHLEQISPPLAEDEEPNLAVRVLPQGRLDVTFGERPPLRVELPGKLPPTGHVGVFVKDARVTLADFLVEIFP